MELIVILSYTSTTNIFSIKSLQALVTFLGLKSGYSKEKVPLTIFSYISYFELPLNGREPVII